MEEGSNLGRPGRLVQDFGFLGGRLSLEGKKKSVQAPGCKPESVSILLFVLFCFLRYGGLEFAATVLGLLSAGVPGTSHHAK